MLSAGQKLTLDRGCVQVSARKRLVLKHIVLSAPRSGVLCRAASEDAAAPETSAEAPATDQPAKVPLSEILPGQEYQGTVKAVAAYGCFVDIGSSTDGLVHISQLSSGFVKDINSFVKVGQTVQVKVLGVEGENKIALSMKTGADEGAGEAGGEGRRAPRMGKKVVDHGLSVGDKVKGEVMRIAGFGAFLKLPDGFEVLLPTAEMSAAEDLDPNPHTLVTVGNVMDVTVLKVDGSKVGVTAISDEDRASMAETSKGASSEGASSAIGGSLMSDLAGLGLEDMFAK